MATCLRALRHDGVSPGLSGADSLGNITGHVHDLRTGIVSTLKIIAQGLILSCPREGDDRWFFVQRNCIHFFLDLKQQMIDAEGLVGSLTDGSDLGVQRRGVECRGAEGPEAARI